MNYPEQQKEVINGLSYNYLCHIQDVSGAGNVYPAHYHSYIEILYGISGDYEVLLNGKVHQFSSGDLVIINSKEVHQIDCLSHTAGQYIVLRFEPEVIYNSMFSNSLQFKYVLPFILETSNHQKIIQKEQLAPIIPELLYDILEEFKTQHYGYELAIKNHIGRIFLWVLRYFHLNGADFYMTNDINMDLLERLQPALDYIDLHYDEQLSSAQLAVICNMSDSYFSRSFNTQMKMGVTQYINYVRITQAEKLLISSSLNITEIASSVGFNTTSYFIKLFKDYKYVSPKQFRRMISTNLNNKKAQVI